MIACGTATQRRPARFAAVMPCGESSTAIVSSGPEPISAHAARYVSGVGFVATWPSATHEREPCRAGPTARGAATPSRLGELDAIRQQAELVGFVEPFVHAGSRHFGRQQLVTANAPRFVHRVDVDSAVRGLAERAMSSPPAVPISAAHSSTVSGGHPCAANASCHAMNTGPSVSRISPSKSKTTARITRRPDRSGCAATRRRRRPPLGRLPNRACTTRRPPARPREPSRRDPVRHEMRHGSRYPGNRSVGRTSAWRWYRARSVRRECRAAELGAADPHELREAGFRRRVVRHRTVGEKAGNARDRDDRAPVPRMTRPHSRRQTNAPRRLTFITRSHSSVGRSSSGRLPPTPAFRIATSSRPIDSVAAATASTTLRFVGNVENERCVGRERLGADRAPRHGARGLKGARTHAAPMPLAPPGDDRARTVEIHHDRR